MKSEEIIRVEVTEDEIINLIRNWLNDNGVEAIGNIEINIKEKDVSEYGISPKMVKYIAPTIIECKKFKN